MSDDSDPFCNYKMQWVDEWSGSRVYFDMLHSDAVQAIKYNKQQSDIAI